MKFWRSVSSRSSSIIATPTPECVPCKLDWNRCNYTKHNVCITAIGRPWIQWPGLLYWRSCHWRPMYPPVNEHGNGTSPFSTGDTPSFMLVFPIVMLVFRFFLVLQITICQPAILKDGQRPAFSGSSPGRFLRSSSPGQSCHRSTGQRACIKWLLCFWDMMLKQQKPRYLCWWQSLFDLSVLEINTSIEDDVFLYRFQSFKWRITP